MNITRTEIVNTLESIADFLQIKGDEPGKIKAYRWAARTLDTLQEDITLLYERDELGKIPGVGPRILEKIKELITTGRCEYYEVLKDSIPKGVMDLMSIQGVGPGTTAKLYQELNIDSVEALQEALDAGKLGNVKGFGKKTQEKIRIGIDALIRHRLQKLMGYVLPPAQAVVESLSKVDGVYQVSLAGCLRRWAETIKDAQIVVACKDFRKIQVALADMEWITQVDENWTDSGGSARLVDDVKLNVKLVSPEDFGSALICYTGSEEHLIGLNHLAKNLNPGEIWKDIPVPWAKNLSEADIYTLLKLPFIPPEIREGRGEINAALSQSLPDLVNIQNIRGDLHVHSTWSDGNETIEAMVQAARKMGYEYISISDHSVSSKIANGLDIERILNKMIEVREVNEKIPDIKILMGAEVDILKDGRLDYPDRILEKLDIVIASVHNGFNMDEAIMTERIIKAIENRFVHIIGHPTGRLLGRRDPYHVNIDALIDAAAEFNKAFEINAYPDRLDFNDINSRKSKDHGVMLAINTDAHSAIDLGFMIYGVHTARRGWLESKDVLNTFPLTELMNWLTIDIQKKNLDL
jgi:DNA polymerase (family 10)